MRAPLPGSLQVEPVGRCNLHCRMGPVHLRPANGTAQMPFDEFLRLLDGFPSARELHLPGLGDALMHPRFFVQRLCHDFSPAYRAFRSGLANGTPADACRGCALYRRPF